MVACGETFKRTSTRFDSLPLELLYGLFVSRGLKSVVAIMLPAAHELSGRLGDPGTINGSLAFPTSTHFTLHLHYSAIATLSLIPFTASTFVPSQRKYEGEEGVEVLIRLILLGFTKRRQQLHVKYLLPSLSRILLLSSCCLRVAVKQSEER